MIVMDVCQSASKVKIGNILGLPLIVLKWIFSFGAELRAARLIEDL